MQGQERLKPAQAVSEAASKTCADAIKAGYLPKAAATVTAKGVGIDEAPLLPFSWDKESRRCFTAEDDLLRPKTSNTFDSDAGREVAASLCTDQRCPWVRGLYRWL